MIMPWLLVLGIAAALGGLLSLFMRRFGMGAIVCVPIAMIGAGLGGLLHHIYNPDANLAFYAIAVVMSVLSLGGGLYAFFLTSSERRI